LHYRCHINTVYYYIIIPVLGVYPKDPGDLGQRTREVQLVSRPGHMAVAEVFQVVIKTRSHGHPSTPSGYYLIVSGRPELTHIQTVFGHAPVDGNDKLSGSVPQQSLQKLDHCSGLGLLARLWLQMIQSWESAVRCEDKTHET
jgi:hypothetical protein